MPVYDDFSNVVDPLTAVDILVDAGASPEGVRSVAASEEIYLALQAFYGSPQAFVPFDGSLNIVESMQRWQTLMHWATQAWTLADDYDTEPLIENVMALFAERANTSGIAAPYWKNVQGSIFTLVQPAVLTQMIGICRATAKAFGQIQP